MLWHEAVIYVGDDLLSHALSRTVQSALRGLTSVFGMGTGISHAVKSPASLTWIRLAPHRSGSQAWVARRTLYVDLERTLAACSGDSSQLNSIRKASVAKGVGFSNN